VDAIKPWHITVVVALVLLVLLVVAAAVWLTLSLVRAARRR
jgi:hypothetical protein